MRTRMREPLIKQALNFLTNPGLKSTSWEKKQSFLEGKGLTAEEIEEARRRVEVKEAESTAQPSPVLASPPRGMPLPPSTAVNVATSVSPSVRTFMPPAVSSQAVLLLRRRLAELEHERACYVEALGALGDHLQEDPRAATVATPAMATPTHSAKPGAPLPQPPPPSVPSTASAAAPSSPAEGQTSPLSHGRVPEPAPKPWETTPKAPMPASGGGGSAAPSSSSGSPSPSSSSPSAPPPPIADLSAPLRDDDPDLMEIVPPKKSKL